jgi:cytochrome c peroxidase
VPPAAPATARYEPPPAGSYALPPFGRVSDHELLDSSGARAPLLDFGPQEAALVAFVYLHCPDACPRATAVLQELDRTLAAQPEVSRRVSLVTVSFDPARDRPERMAALRKALAPRGRWRFLTAANAAALEPVLQDFGQHVVRAPDALGRPEVASHVLKVFLLDGQRRIRNVYSSSFLDARVLRNDLLTLLEEHSQRQPGS